MLRHLGALLVVFHHCSYLMYGNHRLLATANGYYTPGSIGLMLFFCISGYLVTDSLLKSNSVKDYLVKRTLRILPPLSVVVLITVFILGPLLTKLSCQEYFLNSETWIYLLNSTSLTARFPLPGVMNGETINSNLWTLPYEARLYLLFAVLGVFNLKRNRMVHWIILLLLILYEVLYALKMPVTFRYLNMDLASFFVAASLIRLMNVRISRWWIYLLLPIPLLITWNTSFYPLFEIFILSILIIEFGRGKRLIKWYLGGIDFSYNIYLISYPIQLLLFQWFAWYNAFVFFGATVAVMIPLNYVSWNFLEKKFLKLKPS